MPLLQAGPSRFLGRRAAWYRAGGSPAPVAAYQPKGAASLAASYVNLANPGTYNAAPGVAPTLGANGWTFDGTTQYLTTGVIPDVTTSSWSMIARIVGASGATNNTIAGCVDATPTPDVVFTLICRPDGPAVFAGNGQSAGGLSVTVTSGVIALAGSRVYIDGVDRFAAGTTIGGINTRPATIYIGASYTNGAVASFFTGTIAALTIYNTTLTAAQVAAVSAAMAAL